MNITLNPATSWLAALALAFLASSSSNIWWLALFCAVPLAAIWRHVHKNSKPFPKLFLVMAMLVVVVRVGFRVVFGHDSSGPGWALPVLRLDLGWLGELQLFGFVSVDSILAGVTDGLRLAAIILAIGMASTIVGARTLLRHTPAALYELSTAVSISVNLAPQLIASLQRVQRARALRGRSRKVSLLASIVIPVLEDTIDQSLALAASMDARGFGYLRAQSRGRLRVLLAGAFVLIAIGVYLLLTGVGWMAFAAIALALVATTLAVRSASRSSVRTSAVALNWSAADRLVVGAILIAVALRLFGWWSP